MEADQGSLNLHQAQWVMEGLYSLGITTIIISPGSRSTPLTVAAADSDMHTIIHFDERGAAFHALGIARVTGMPTGLICTSGTAVANYFPAILEADADQIPLLIMTADRPDELVDRGANQTVHQKDIYGARVRGFHNFKPPTEGIAKPAILEEVSQAIEISLDPVPGPVHLNFQYREPLIPEERHLQDEPESDPVTLHLLSRSVPTGQISPNLLTDQGIILMGRLDPSADSSAIPALAEHLGWPILPDIQSQLRHKRHPALINHFDLLLIAADLFRSDRPVTILHFGVPFVSKRLNQWLETAEIERFLHVHPTELRYDPGGRITQRIQAEMSPVIDQMIKDIPARSASPLLERLQSAESWVSTILEEQGLPISENPTLVQSTIKNIGAGENLFLASSMPIRAFDMFSPSTDVSIDVYANRGVSGIDGTIATAAGVATASRKATTLVIGDLAFLHDLNSLALVKDLEIPFPIILINNGGGGIFHFLPVVRQTDIFERFFGTPHHLSDFRPIATQFSLNYHSAETTDEFTTVYREARSTPGATLIELQGDRQSGPDHHLEIYARIKQNFQNG